MTIYVETSGEQTWPSRNQSERSDVPQDYLPYKKAVYLCVDLCFNTKRFLVF